MPRMHTAAVLPTITTSLGLTALLGGPSMAGDMNRFDVGWSDIDVFFIDFSTGEVPDNVQDFKTGDPGRYFNNFGWSNVDIDVCWNAGSSYTGWASEVAFNIRMSEAGITQWYIAGSPFSGDDTGADAEGTCSNRQALAAAEMPLAPFTYAVDASGIVGTGMSATWNDGTGLRHSEVNTADFYFVLGEEIPAGCEGATGSCGEFHPEPGCDDISCCAAVCDIDTVCCEVAWDTACADLAIVTCGIFQYSCNAPAYPNDCASDAQVLVNGQTVNFETILANYDGPIISCAGSGGPNVWYLIQVNEEDDQELTASTCNAAAFDTALTLWDMGEVGDPFDGSSLEGAEVACNDDGAGCADFSSLLSYDMTAGRQYLLSVSGYEGSVGTGTLTVGWEGSDPPIPPQTCDTPGPDTITQNTTDVMTTGGVACGSGSGSTTENAYCRVYTQAEVGDAFTIDCIRFGVTNPGSYLPAKINVYNSLSGNPAPLADMTMLASNDFGLYTTAGIEYNEVSFGDGVEVDLSDGSALVIEIEIPPSLDGFVTFGGGTGVDISSGTTYIRTKSCGITEYLPVVDIGFDIEWFVFINGTAGGICRGDFDDNGIVRSPDLGRLLVAWGDCEGCPEDLDGDGQVSAADLGILVANWGPCP